MTRVVTCSLTWVVLLAGSARAADLGKQYPATLDYSEQPRGYEWTCGEKDVWRLREFRYSLGENFSIELGPSKVVLGCHETNVLWTAIFPNEPGTITRASDGQGEHVTSVWLRFHPARVAELFPAETVVEQSDAAMVHHTDLTDKKQRACGPKEPWHYVGPVVVLQGQRTMSSAESFALMLAQCPQVTTMGDRTAGSSGNPRRVDAGAGIVVNLPRWIDMDPDGKSIESVGIRPKVFIETSAADFGDEQDPVLSAAVKHVRESEKPDGGVLKVRPGAVRPKDRPRVVSVSPPDGAADADPITEIRIRFDRPMNPATHHLAWDSDDRATANSTSLCPRVSSAAARPRLHAGRSRATRRRLRSPFPQRLRRQRRANDRALGQDRAQRPIQQRAGLTREIGNRFARERRPHPLITAYLHAGLKFSETFQG